MFIIYFIFYLYTNFLFKDLLQGSRELDQLYKKSEKSTFALKESFDDLKQKERVVNNLHDRYYNALVTKKFHEQDRDEFFKVKAFLFSKT